MEQNWYNVSTFETIKKLNSDVDQGLSSEEAEKRQAQYGFNELKEKKKKSLIVQFLEQFKDFMIIILIIAAIVSAIVGIKQGEGFADSVIIMVVVIANAIIGLVQENKAEKSLEALKKMSSHVAKVYRNGKIEVVKSRELVPGDIVEIETGDFVPADLRIINAINLKVQEAALTGESVPVDKNTDPIKGEVPLGDRTNLLFSSSMVTYGRGKGIVVATGMETEVGKIATMINEVEEKETLLQAKLNSLGKTLGILCVIICLVIFLVGLAYKKDPINMFMTAVSLAVAAIPEGLAAISTIVLAIGVQRMVKRNAIVKKLPAVETLGSASVICTDKTGTLTQNKMTVQKIYTNSKLEKIEDIENQTLSKELEYLIEDCMLCNDTKIGNDHILTGDPTETALVDMGFRFHYTKDIYKECPRIAEIPFDSNRKLMTTVHKVGDRFIIYTKGGVDELLACCKGYSLNGEVCYDLDQYKDKILKENESMAEDALRVLAMGYKELDHPLNEEDMKNLEKDLIYVGMIGMIDPPRLEVKDAVKKCVSAGIKTVMITGDHKVTAVAIAKELGILSEGDWAITGNELENMSDEDLKKNVKNITVYARVSPEHKVRIVNAWQANGEIVAMTGDGVNDAPALKTADIGCAMGIVGTDVAKEAADVVLTDDNFATIVSAIEEGRRIFDNILKAITFLLSSNIGEIIVLFLAIMLTPILANKFEITSEFINNIVPLIPVQILWINLVTDSLPALALAVDPPNKNIMTRKPNKNQKGIFTKGMTFRIIYQGIMIGLISLAAFVIGLSTNTNDVEYKIKVGQTMAFLVLAFAELVHVFNIRNNKESILKSNPFNNSKLILAILLSTILMASVLLIPALRNVFHLVLLPADKLLETIILIISPLFIVELMKLLKLNTTKDEN